jgi:hypothetical protein
MSHTSELLGKYSRLKEQHEEAANVLDMELLSDTSREMGVIEHEIEELSN